MAQPTPRLHRLPQRLDYTLIPAPLDLSLPLVTEKSHLPAIIVTPSSPSSSRDFSIAFFAPEEKPSIQQRIANYAAPLKCRGRPIILILFLLFVFICHVVTHRLATRRPHLQFSIQNEPPATSTQLPLDWFDLGTLLKAVADEKREFAIANEA